MAMALFSFLPSFLISFLFPSFFPFSLISQSPSLNLPGARVLCCGYMGAAASVAVRGNHNNGFMGNFFREPKDFDEEVVSPGGTK